MAYDSLNPITVRRNIRKKFKEVMTELLQVSDERKYKAIQENDNCLMATFEGMVLKSFLKEEDRVPKEIKEAVRNSIKDILLQGQTEFAPTDDEIQKRAKVIIKLIAASIKRQLSGNIRVRKHLLDEMAKMKALEKKRKVHEELLMTVQVTVSIEECKEALELAKLNVQAIPSINEEKEREQTERHEINVFMENVRKELLLKVQVIPSIDEEEERKTSELAERHEINVFMENVRKELPLKVQAIPSIDEEEERKTRELAEEEKVQKKIKDNVKMKVDVKRKPEGRLKRIRRRIRRLFCCVRDEHST